MNVKKIMKWNLHRLVQGRHGNYIFAKMAYESHVFWLPIEASESTINFLDEILIFIRTLATNRWYVNVC